LSRIKTALSGYAIDTLLTLKGVLLAGVKNVENFNDQHGMTIDQNVWDGSPVHECQRRARVDIGQAECPSCLHPLSVDQPNVGLQPGSTQR